MPYQGLSSNYIPSRASRALGSSDGEVERCWIGTIGRGPPAEEAVLMPLPGVAVVTGSED